MKRFLRVQRRINGSRVEHQNCAAEFRLKIADVSSEQS